MTSKLNLKLVPLGIAAVTSMMFASAASAQNRPVVGPTSAGQIHYNTGTQTPDSAQVIGGGAPLVRNGMGGSPPTQYPSSAAVAVSSYCGLYACNGQSMTVTTANSGGTAPTISYGHVENGAWASDSQANQPLPQVVPWASQDVAPYIGQPAAGGGYNPGAGWNVMTGFNPQEPAPVAQNAVQPATAPPQPFLPEQALFRNDAPAAAPVAAIAAVAPYVAPDTRMDQGDGDGSGGGGGGDSGDGGSGDSGGAGGDSA